MSLILRGLNKLTCCCWLILDARKYNNSSGTVGLPAASEFSNETPVDQDLGNVLKEVSVSECPIGTKQPHSVAVKLMYHGRILSSIILTLWSALPWWHWLDWAKQRGLQQWRRGYKVVSLVTFEEFNCWQNGSIKRTGAVGKHEAGCKAQLTEVFFIVWQMAKSSHKKLRVCFLHPLSLKHCHVSKCETTFYHIIPSMYVPGWWFDFRPVLNVKVDIVASDPNASNM